MSITERQKLILDNLVAKYIELATPISSGFLAKNHNFEFSPATIRIEMANLENEGYLFQPYISSGRVPTEKAYRLFIKSSMKKEVSSEEKKYIEKIKSSKKRAKKSLKTAVITLSFLSNNFSFGGIIEDGIIFQDGLAKLFGEPEFQEESLFSDFAKSFEYLTKNFEEFFEKPWKEDSLTLVGKENPLPGFENFGLMGSRIFLDRSPAFLGILGPKRMNYPRNLSLINSIKRVLEKG